MEANELLKKSEKLILKPVVSPKIYLRESTTRLLKVEA